MPLEREQYRPTDVFRHMMARWEVEELRRRLELESLEAMEQKVLKLIAMGFTLIPSGHLKTNEIVVSEDLYKAAKGLLDKIEKL